MPRTTAEQRASWRQIALTFREGLQDQRDACDETDPIDAGELNTIRFLEGLCDRLVILTDDLDSREGSHGEEKRQSPELQTEKS